MQASSARTSMFAPTVAMFHTANKKMNIEDGSAMPSCFVIQPFDGGKFDKRFADVFKPAIVAAGLEPYRVDRDPSVSIPINDIELGIKGSSVCFADITLDNPNVWFELGFALASDKEICLICSEERQTRFPFDVQHRTIIKYNVDSLSDYDTLREKITNRLSAILEKSAKIAVMNTASPIKSGDLNLYEMIVLATIMENRHGPGEYISHWIIKNNLEQLGYNNLALNIGVERLLKKKMIRIGRESDFNHEPFTVYYVEDMGINWLLENSDKLEFATPKPQNRKKSSTSDLDDEIPF